MASSESSIATEVMESNRLVIAAWLDTLQLSQYCPLFAEFESDIIALSSVNEQKLFDIGIADTDHIRTIMTSIEEAAEYARVQRQAEEKLHQEIDGAVMRVVAESAGRIFKTPSDVSQLMKSIGHPELVKPFKAAKVDLYSLMSSNDRDLQEFGIVDPLPLRRILVAIDQLHEEFPKYHSQKKFTNSFKPSGSSEDNKSCSLM
eukprot:ANDGO_05129.mRNA.1 hypothetical protein